MQVWLKIWNFLDENPSINSLVDISRNLKISYPSVLKNIKVLEKVGYVNVIGNRSKKSVVKTKKFTETRKNIRELYEKIKE